MAVRLPPLLWGDGNAQPCLPHGPLWKVDYERGSRHSGRRGGCDPLLLSEGIRGTGYGHFKHQQGRRSRELSNSCLRAIKEAQARNPYSDPRIKIVIWLRVSSRWWTLSRKAIKTAKQKPLLGISEPSRGVPSSGCHLEHAPEGEQAPLHGTRAFGGFLGRGMLARALTGSEGPQTEHLSF